MAGTALVAAVWSCCRSGAGVRHYLADV